MRLSIFATVSALLVVSLGAVAAPVALPEAEAAAAPYYGDNFGWKRAALSNRDYKRQFGSTKDW